MLSRLSLLFGLGMSLSLILTPTQAFALTNITRSSYPLASRTPLPTPDASAIQAKLQGAKLQACQANYQKIVDNSNAALQQATLMYQTLTYSAQATEAYYKTQSTLTKKTLPNYNQLVAAVQTTGNAVPPELQTAQTDINSFNCQSSNPSQQIVKYDQDVTALVQDLLAYQTAVTNLIEGVQSIFPAPAPSTK